METFCPKLRNYWSPKRLSLIIGLLVLFLFGGTIHGQEVLARHGDYLLSADEAEDGRSPVLTLSKGGQAVSRSEDPFALLMICGDSKTKERMTRQFVRRDIRKNGGAKIYQATIDHSIRNSGENFYRHICGLYKWIAEEYRSQGVDLRCSAK